jgi:hypothetical protein
MSHEMSKKHQEQVAEKTAILVNHAFRLGRVAERQHIIDLLMNEPISEQVGKVINMLKDSEVQND